MRYRVARDYLVTGVSAGAMVGPTLYPEARYLSSGRAGVGDLATLPLHVAIIFANADILFLHLGFSRMMTADRRSVNLSGVDRTYSDPVPPTELLPLTTIARAVDVLGSRGPHTATA